MNSKIGMKIFVLITTSKEFLKFCLICVQMQINSLENGTVNNTHSKESEFLIKAEKIQGLALVFKTKKSCLNTQDLSKIPLNKAQTELVLV